jgi:hypothetical protein
MEGDIVIIKDNMHHTLQYKTDNTIVSTLDDYFI